MNIELPRQLQNGLVEEEVKKQAQQGAYGATGVIIVQFGVQIVLKGAMDSLFDLYMKLQLVNCLSKFSIYQTAVVEMYFEQLSHLIEFKMLKPDFFLQLIDENLSMAAILNGV